MLTCTNLQSAIWHTSMAMLEPLPQPAVWPQVEDVEDDEADLYEDLPARSPATTAPAVSGRDLARLRKAAAKAVAADAGQGDSDDSSHEDVGQEEGESLGIPA